VQRYKKNLIYTNLFVFFNKNDTLFVNLLPDIARSEKKSVHFVIALGIGRATVLGTNAELVNPSQAGRPQSVITLLGGSRFSRSVGRTLRPFKPDRRSSGEDDLQNYRGTPQ
jgi:hypothetical protein